MLGYTQYKKQANETGEWSPYPGPSKGLVDVKQVEVADVVQRGEHLFLHDLRYSGLHRLKFLCGCVDLVQEGI